MYLSNQKACNLVFTAILILLLIGCSGPMNMKEEDQKYTNKLDQDSVQRGQVLYQNHCQQCHGESGHGDGPKAKELTQKPTDLTESGLHITRYGMRAVIDFPHYSPESVRLKMKYGNDLMPTYKDTFTEQEQKDITNFVLKLLHL